MSLKTEVILLAAGQGRRMGGSLPKAFVPLAGVPVFTYSVKVFSSLPEISNLILVIPSGQEDQARKHCQQQQCLDQIQAIVSPH